jgi:hypothetical protein
LPQVGRELLHRFREGTRTQRVTVGVADDAFECRFA